MNELALFAGTGGGVLGGKQLGWETVCAVEINAYCQRVLLARQNDGSLPPFPIWNDVRTFDGVPWRGIVDVVSGGFPCQDISEGNAKAIGIDGPRSGLWKSMARIIGEVRPLHAIVENSPRLPRKGLERILGDLNCMGYNARWGTLASSHTGQIHRRRRLWIVASDSARIGWKGFAFGEGRPLAERSEIEKRRAEFERLVRIVLQSALPAGKHGRVADGVARRMDRLSAIGNGQQPECVELAWQTLAP